MRFFSPLLRSVLYPGLASAGYFKRRVLAGNLCVLNYHGVLPRAYKSRDAVLDGHLVSAETLRAQLRLLKARYNIVSFKGAMQCFEVDGEIPQRSVLLTSDDGLQNVLTDMLPVLQEEGVPCLFFVTGASTSDCVSMLWYEELYLLLMNARDGFVNFPDLNLAAKLGDQRHKRLLWWTWVKELSRHNSEVRHAFLKSLEEQCALSEHWKLPYQTGAAHRRFCLMTDSELRELAGSGMEIGAHTMTHPVLAHCSPDMVWEEMTRSREVLSRLLGQPVWAMAYPFGDPGSAGIREFQTAERAGYKCAFVNFGGGFGATSSRFAIPRVHVTSDMSLSEFEAHVSGFHQALKQRFGRQDARPCA
jgi:peptidoglycan/xylan/chitin deacetylase (PgdA/CDA1 family)